MKKKCHLCPKKYQSQNDLDDHLRKIHGLTVAHIKQYSEEEKSNFIKQCQEILNKLNQDKKEKSG